MLKTLPRTGLKEKIQRGLSKFPVVALLGARQVGKTTLARQISESWHEPVTYFDLELSSSLAGLSVSPENVLNSCEGLVVIDEIQRLPELFTVLRPICDNAARSARFLVLGSTSPELVRGVSESLAGRIGFIDVSGFSLPEVCPTNQNQLWFRGGFPNAYLAQDDQEWLEWVEGFARTFLSFDLSSLDDRVSPQTIDRFWKMVAHYHGKTWNASEFARSLSVYIRDVNKYRDLLEGSFMIRVLPPWYENLGKRLIKSPRIYVRDSGILHFLLGLMSFPQVSSHPIYGASWEGFALEQVLTYFGDRDAYYYRTQKGTELDLLLIRNGKRWGFEFKCSDGPRTTRSMHHATKDLGLAHLWILYPGSMSYPLTENISVSPLRELSKIELN